MPCHHVIPCHSVSCYHVTCHATPLPCSAMPCRCHALPSHNILCNCLAMLCYIMLSHSHMTCPGMISARSCHGMISARSYTNDSIPLLSYLICSNRTHLLNLPTELKGKGLAKPASGIDATNILILWASNHSLQKRVDG